MVEPRIVPPGRTDPRFVPACIHLRCKTQFYRDADQDQPPGMIADSPTLSYWCARTEDFTGPDRDGCDPRRCQHARACFEGPRGLG